MHSEHQRAMLAQPAAGCHAVARCGGAACFQVRVEASPGRRPVLHWANACAAHIGDLVEGVKAWAHDGSLCPPPLWVGGSFRQHSASLNKGNRVLTSGGAAATDAADSNTTITGNNKAKLVEPDIENSLIR